MAAILPDARDVTGAPMVPAMPDASAPPDAYDVERPLADLRELAELTGGPGGARRVAWTEEWARAREWLKGKLAELPVGVEEDAAGNLWATLPGARDTVLVVGSHVDSVPAGGWLDGSLGICAALEVLRRHERATPPVTLRLVDWADEEGARFGRSLFGSSAAAGTLVADDVRGLTDAQGTTLPGALAERGIDIDRVGEAAGGLDGAGAYLELHIEQGPALEERGLPAGAVIGCNGVERHAVTFTGRPSHAGSTPMHLRRDAFLAAARFALRARESAVERGGVATIGGVHAEPGVPTIINGRCEVTLDQRAFDAGALSAMLADARAAADDAAGAEGVDVSWRRIWSIPPTPFHPELVDLAERACREVNGGSHRLPSGALHDAAEASRLVPTVMVFASSTDGISHSPAEDTPEDDLRGALAAYGRLAELTATWLVGDSR
jgi:N-carbamoyl-L-amino-acid hydrolase